MAKIKAGDFQALADGQAGAWTGTVPILVQSINEVGDFVVTLGGAHMTPQQARDNAAVMLSAADKAEILTAAME